MDLPHPALDHVCDLTVDLAPIREVGRGRAGDRRIIPIIGGTVSGPHLNGTILNIGADWQTLFGPEFAELDTRYAFETDNGAVIEVKNYGYRHGPSAVLQALTDGHDVPATDYYMRTHARLETGDPRYDWVNRTLFIGVGARKRSSVLIRLYALL